MYYYSYTFSDVFVNTFFLTLQSCFHTNFPVMANFMCQFDWPKGYPDSWKNLILGMSMRIFLEDFSIWFNILKSLSSPMWEGVTGCLNRTKRSRKGEFSLSSWAETSIFSCPRTLESWESGFKYPWLPGSPVFRFRLSYTVVAEAKLTVSCNGWRLFTYFP